MALGEKGVESVGHVGTVQTSSVPAADELRDLMTSFRSMRSNVTGFPDNTNTAVRRRFELTDPTHRERITAPLPGSV